MDFVIQNQGVWDQMRCRERTRMHRWKVSGRLSLSGYGHSRVDNLPPPPQQLEHLAVNFLRTLHATGQRTCGAYALTHAHAKAIRVFKGE